jgi:hypothetical protein
MVKSLRNQRELEGAMEERGRVLSVLLELEVGDK